MRELTRLLKPYYQIAEGWLYHAPRRLEDAEHKIHVRFSNSSTSVVKFKPDASKSDTPAAYAQAAAELDRIEAWCRLVDQIMAIDEETRKLIELKRRFGRGKRGKEALIKITRGMVKAGFNYSTGGVKEQWRAIVNYTALIASQRGLIAPKSTWINRDE